MHWTKLASYHHASTILKLVEPRKVKDDCRKPLSGVCMSRACDRLYRDIYKDREDVY